jgi:DNA repair protein RadA/Sms
MEGRRALVTEVQALVGEEQPMNPRRATSGLDSQRVAMLLAVLERRLGLKLAKREVYTATVGGVRLAEPAADLSLALAIAGSLDDRAILPGLVAIGEVGLAGELRPVSAIRARVAEAARLGFTTALVPPGCTAAHPQLRTVEASDLADAVGHALPALRARAAR